MSASGSNVVADTTECTCQASQRIIQDLVASLGKPQCAQPLRVVSRSAATRKAERLEEKMAISETLEQKLRVFHESLRGVSGFLPENDVMMTFLVGLSVEERKMLMSLIDNVPCDVQRMKFREGLVALMSFEIVKMFENEQN